MWAQYIGPIFTGLGALVTAFGGIVLARSRQIQADLADCQRDSTRRDAELRHFRVTALRHVYQLERLLAQTTMSVPDRPDELLF